MPWLKSGGADLVVLNYVKALTEDNMAEKIVVISTENADSPWAKKLPVEVQFIEFGKLYSHLSARGTGETAHPTVFAAFATCYSQH